MNTKEIELRKCYLDEDLLGVNFTIIQGNIEEEDTDVIGKSHKKIH